MIPSQLHFTALADRLMPAAGAGETLLLGWQGEDSDFVRLSRSRVRQAGSVRQRSASLELVAGGRALRSELDLAGGDDDHRRLADELARLRALLPLVPPDPHLLVGDQPLALVRCDPPAGGDAQQAVAALCALAADLDLAGIYAAGRIERGFASSHGARCWHEVALDHLGASAYLPDGQAVQFSWAGPAFDAEAQAALLARVRTQLATLARPPRSVPLGEHRVLLEPAALAELISMMSWGGFSCRARRTRTSPLLRLEEGARLHPAVDLAEDAGAGLAPRFTARGFAIPARTGLIRAGVLGDPLVDARSAREYSLEPNAAEESPSALALAPGRLPRAQALARLGTGLWIGNLWYCNLSDRSACRITGMTRFACLWVEDGVPVAPAARLRFDDTIERLLGSQLEELTCERDLLPDGDTYGGRATRQRLLPAALIGAMRFIG